MSLWDNCIKSKTVTLTSLKTVVTAAAVKKTFASTTVSLVQLVLLLCESQLYLRAYKFPNLHIGFFGKGRARSNHFKDFSWHVKTRLPQEIRDLNLVPDENIHAISEIPEEVEKDERFEWHRRHSHIRGQGFWYWRPLIISKLFRESIPHNALMLWLDAGNEIGSSCLAQSQWEWLIRIAGGIEDKEEESDPDSINDQQIFPKFDITALHSDYREKNWLKGIVFKTIVNSSSDDSYYANSAMMPTTAFLMRNTALVRDKFLKYWAELMSKPLLVSDQGMEEKYLKEKELESEDVAQGLSEQFYSSPNHASFRENREQGVFSLLLKANEPHVMGCTMESKSQNLTQNHYGGWVAGWNYLWKKKQNPEDYQDIQDSKSFFLARPRLPSSPHGYGIPGLKVQLIPNFLEPPHMCSVVAATRGSGSAKEVTEKNWVREIEIGFLFNGDTVTRSGLSYSGSRLLDLNDFGQEWVDNHTGSVNQKDHNLSQDIKIILDTKGYTISDHDYGNSRKPAVASIKDLNSDSNTPDSATFEITTSNFCTHVDNANDQSDSDSEGSVKPGILLTMLSQATFGLQSQYHAEKVKQRVDIVMKELGIKLENQESEPDLKDPRPFLRSLFVWADQQLCIMKAKMLAGSVFRTRGQIGNMELEFGSEVKIIKDDIDDNKYRDSESGSESESDSQFDFNPTIQFNLKLTKINSDADIIDAQFWSAELSQEYPQDENLKSLTEAEEDEESYIQDTDSESDEPKSDSYSNYRLNSIWQRRFSLLKQSLISESDSDNTPVRYVRQSSKKARPTSTLSPCAWFTMNGMCLYEAARYSWPEFFKVTGKCTGIASENGDRDSTDRYSDKNKSRAPEKVNKKLISLTDLRLYPETLHAFLLLLHRAAYNSVHGNIKYFRNFEVRRYSADVLQFWIREGMQMYEYYWPH